jgi:thiamine-monophosphate kinase
MLGAGDDCALFSVKPGMQLATSTDLLLEGRHFFSGTDPFRLGHKALAVNLSDLAAVGAKPVACLLGLGLPSVDEQWVSRFADGFYALADEFGCVLIGGDTTRSVQGVTLSVTVFGEVEPNLAMRRSAAVLGDDIWMSGVLGAADIACRMLSGELPMDEALLTQTRLALEKPTPRVALGRRLAPHVHAAIDLSDGLVQDLGHILKASGVAAELQEVAIPVHQALTGYDAKQVRRAMLAGGDVYELCFTAAPAQRDSLHRIAIEMDVPLTRIGRITDGAGVVVRDADGDALSNIPSGFDHFRSSGDARL